MSERIHMNVIYVRNQCTKFIKIPSFNGVVPKNGTRCYESMRRDALPYMR